MKKLFFIVLLTISMSAIAQTFSFRKIEVYKNDELVSERIEKVTVKIQDEFVTVTYGTKKFLYEIEDGDGVIYILRDLNGKQNIMGFENNLCVFVDVIDSKRAVILKK